MYLQVTHYILKIKKMEKRIYEIGIQIRKLNKAVSDTIQGDYKNRELMLNLFDTKIRKLVTLRNNLYRLSADY